MKEYLKEIWQILWMSQIGLVCSMVLLTMMLLITSLFSSKGMDWSFLVLAILIYEVFTVGCLILKLIIDYIKLFIKNMK
jgi:hypothetical protein